MADYHTSDCLGDRLIDWELSIWVNRDSFSSVIFPTVSTVNRMGPPIHPPVIGRVPIERTGLARGPLVFKLTSSDFMCQKN